MKRFLTTLSAGALPFVALAQSADLTYITDLIATIGSIVNTLIPILIAIAVIYFIWQVIKYVIAASDESKKEARTKMIYGIVGLAVIISIWGLVSLLQTAFGIEDTQLEENEIPTVPGLE